MASTNSPPTPSSNVHDSNVVEELLNGSVNPTKAQIQSFMAEYPHDTPIQMLNLIRYRPLAAYPPDHKLHNKGIKGSEAYKLYFQHTLEFFEANGGKLIFMAEPELVVIGPSHEKWDEVFIGEYPSSTAFFNMIQDPRYQEVAKHRTAAVADSRLIRMKPKKIAKL